MHMPCCSRHSDTDGPRCTVHTHRLRTAVNIGVNHISRQPGSLDVGLIENTTLLHHSETQCASADLFPAETWSPPGSWPGIIWQNKTLDRTGVAWFQSGFFLYFLCASHFRGRAAAVTHPSAQFFFQDQILKRQRIVTRDGGQKPLWSPAPPRWDCFSSKQGGQNSKPILPSGTTSAHNLQPAVTQTAVI